MFPSKSFIVSGLTFRSLNHFKFIFVCGVNFILLHVAVQFSQHQLLKRLSFLHCILLPPLSKTGEHICVGISLGFLSCSIEVYFCFCASSILSWLLKLCSIVWSLGAWFFQLRFSFPRLLCLFMVVGVSKQIVQILFYFCENSIGSLIRIALNL